MKKKLLTAFLVTALGISMLSGCGGKNSDDNSTKSEQSTKEKDQEAADKVAKLIDDIYVQERTDKTDEQCEAAKKAWDALTDAQKELVEGENADPDYFGRDTGDASKDDPLNEDQYDNHIFSFHRVFLHFITICLPPSDIFLQACSCGFLIFHHDFQIPISAPQMVDHFFFL